MVVTSSSIIDTVDDRSQVSQTTTGMTSSMSQEYHTSIVDHHNGGGFGASTMTLTVPRVVPKQDGVDLEMTMMM